MERRNAVLVPREWIDYAAANPTKAAAFVERLVQHARSQDEWLAQTHRRPAPKRDDNLPLGEIDEEALRVFHEEFVAQLAAEFPHAIKPTMQQTRQIYRKVMLDEDSPLTVEDLFTIMAKIEQGKREKGDVGYTGHVYSVLSTLTTKSAEELHNEAESWRKVATRAAPEVERQRANHQLQTKPPAPPPAAGSLDPETLRQIGGAINALVGRRG